LRTKKSFKAIYLDDRGHILYTTKTYAPIKATDYNSGVDEYISDEEKKVKKQLSLEPS
jgi:hypothetical protein